MTRPDPTSTQVAAWSSENGWHMTDPPRVETNAGRFRFVWPEQAEGNPRHVAGEQAKS